jgi:hypothetical protein
MEEGATSHQATRPAGLVSGVPPGTPPSHFKYGPGVAAAPPAGTVNFRWLFQPGAQPPQPGRQSLIAGQGAVYVIEPIEASGPGQKLEKVTLQVTGPGTRSVSTTVRLSC